MATASNAVSPPLWFRVAAALALLWNGIGVSMYLSAVGVFGDPTASLSAAEQAAASSIPAWIMGAFALGTFAGLVGSLGLLLRKRWAQPMLIVSMIALLVLEGWILFFSGALEHFGLAVPIMVSTGAVLLAWLATHAGQRHWLN
jgi:hypothetical protein